MHQGDADKLVGIVVELKTARRPGYTISPRSQQISTAQLDALQKQYGLHGVERLEIELPNNCDQAVLDQLHAELNARMRNLR